MAQNGISLVVPQRVIDETPTYQQQRGTVMSYRGFFENYLDPAMVKWRKEGVI